MNHPFVHFGNLAVKPALILFFVFVACSCIFGIYGAYSNEFRYQIIQSAKNRGKRNRLIAYWFAYAALILLYLFRQPALMQAKLLYNMMELYLRYEALISLIVLLFAMSAVFTAENKDRHISAANRLVQILILVSMFSNLLTELIKPTLPNIIIYLILGVAVLLLDLCEPQVSLQNAGNESGAAFDYHNPVKRVGDLFPLHTRQAEHLAALISSEGSSAPFSICVSGIWGTGKTSVVDAAVQMLRQKQEREQAEQKKKPKKERECVNSYEFIYVNALELDTLSSLFTYIFSQIRQILKSRGVYVGFGSEYKQFVSAAMGSVIDSSVGSLLEHKLLPGQGDYREEKRQLETLLAKALPKGRIVVIVDDIERCEMDKARSFIFFVKEIATMVNCVAVFVTDYEHLRHKQILGDDSPTDNNEYRFYEKFFNYRIDIIDAPLEESMEFFQRKAVTLDETLLYEGFRTPAGLFNEFQQNFNDQIEDCGTKLEAIDSKKPGSKDSIEAIQRRRKKLEIYQSLFDRHFSLARNLAKFFSVLNGYYQTINSRFLDSGQEQLPSSEEIRAYFQKIELDKLLFLMAYIEVSLPAETKQLHAQGQKYLEQLFSIGVLDDEQELFLELCEDILCEVPVFTNNVSFSYKQNDCLRFVDTLFKNPKELYKLVNHFTRQEEEWFAAIEQRDRDRILLQWQKIVTAVLYAPSILIPKKRQEYIEFLLELAKEKVTAGHWDLEQVLFLLEDNHSTARLLEQLAIMKPLCEITKAATEWQFSQKLIKWVNEFSSYYLYYRLFPVHRLLYYWLSSSPEMASSEKEILNTALELFLSSNKPAAQQLTQYADYLSKLPGMAKPPLPSSSGIEQLELLSSQMKTYLEQTNLAALPDVNESINLMEQAVDDIGHFLKLQCILEGCDPQKEKFDIWHLDMTDVEPAIAYFTNALKRNQLSARNDSEIARSFLDLFRRIQEDPSTKLSADQICALHRLASEITQMYGGNPAIFHKVLLDYGIGQEGAQE